MPESKDPVIDVRDLKTSFDTEAGRVTAVDGVSFAVRPGRTLGIVGESGCGKSVTLLSIMRLLPKPSGRIESGAIYFGDQDLATLSPLAMRKIRGRRIAMIFQEPMTALNPVMRIGDQLAEPFRLHFPELSKAEVTQASIELLEKVGIASPAARIREYPQQLSGGMRQRVMIAVALACKPEVLIADEPTTALDVTIQAQILDLIKSLQREFGMAVIFVTHAMGVVAEVCDDVAVMYAGKIVEKGSVSDIFSSPRHPYTHGLLASIPRLDSTRKIRLPVIEGMVPTMTEMPAGCRFANRCTLATDQCRLASPSPVVVGGDHIVHCLRWREVGRS